MATLAELLRQKAEGLINLPQEATRFITNPESFKSLVGMETNPELGGFSAGFSGVSPKPPSDIGVLDPKNLAYTKGYESGEMANLGAAIASPFVAARKLPFLLRSAEPELTPIGQRLQHRLDTQYPSMIMEYKKLPESLGGKVVNTDIARELSPEYVVNRTLSADVHEPASRFVKRYYATRLEQPAPEGSSIMFTGGGTGAGKTSSLEAYPSIAKNAEMIYDTNMNKLGSATKKIDQALDAGRKVDLVYTYRDPIEALTQGSLPRAMRMLAEKGSGRTVPLKEHIKTHVGSRDVIEQLAEKYADNPNVRIGVVNNSFGKGNFKIANIEDLPKHDPKQLEQDLRKALENEYKSGNITKEIYEASQ